MTEKTCNWKAESSFYSEYEVVYKTDCDSIFNGMAYEYHTDRRNCKEFKFCPYCGGNIEIKE